MCGIGGEINFSQNFSAKDKNYQGMIRSLIPRGPDQEGVFFGDDCALLHRRLAVIDLEKGSQPMTVSHKGSTYTMVYNGELYNTEDLRKELAGAGFSFLGHSDTEVVLKSFLHWGKDCLLKFNGIFAFCIWNPQEHCGFFARDPMGVKPFFFVQKPQALIFASEIKTLLKHEDIEAVADENTLSEVLFLGPGRTPGSGVFQGIQELLPGEWGTFTPNGFFREKYFRLQDAPFTDSFETALEKTKFLVNDAIERQLVADVPLGTFLSGGLDSSIISAIAAKKARERGETLETFSVFYKDNEKYFKPGKFQPNSDHEFIDVMAKHIGARNHKFVMDTEDLVEALFDAVDARDLPGMADVDSSLLLFCREIKNSCTVALSGECADEIFGGYPWFRDPSIREAEGFPWAQSTAWRKSFLKDEFAYLDAEAFVAERYKRTLAETDLSATPLDDKENRSAKVMMQLNLSWFMQTLLDRKDRMSMATGLEVRVPFCDRRIAQYLYTVPWAYKDYQNYEKGLLREAVKDLLPAEILWRKKSPYPKTHNPSYVKAVSERLMDEISSANAPILDLVKKDKLEALASTTLETPWYGQLMTVPQTMAYFLQFNYWLKKYHIKIEKS